MEWLAHAAQLSVVAGFVGGILGGIFNFVVLKPLKDTLKSLQAAIEELRKDNKHYRDKIHFIEVTVTEIKAKVENNTHRIEKLETKNHAKVGH